MDDIAHYQLFEEKDKTELAHQLAKAGLYNIGQLILSLYNHIELRDAEDATSSSELSCLQNNIKEFIEIFNNFEVETCVFKTIGKTEFAICTRHDLEQIKDSFHCLLD